MAEGAAGPRGRPPWVAARGFGCLFALLFLRHRRIGRGGQRVRPRAASGRCPGSSPSPSSSCCSAGWAGRCWSPVARSTAWSRRPGASRPATTRSASTPGMPPGRRSRLVDELNVGFDTMADAPRDRRAPAAHAPRRHQPRAPDAADRRPGQPRGDRRRRLPARPRASRPRSSTRRASSAGSSTTSGRSPCPRPARSPSTPNRPTPTCWSPRSSARSSRAATTAGRDPRRVDRRRPADHRPRPGADPRGPREPRRERPRPHPARRPRDGRRRRRSGRLDPPRGPRHRAPASTRRCCPTSSTASSRTTRHAARGWASRSPVSW